MGVFNWRFHLSYHHRRPLKGILKLEIKISLPVLQFKDESKVKSLLRFFRSMKRFWKISITLLLFSEVILEITASGTVCHLDEREEKCLHDSFCNRTYKNIKEDNPPYHDIQFEKIFQDCCGKCFNIEKVIVQDKRKCKNYDFVFPVLSKVSISTSKNNNGLYFIPLLSHSGFYFITRMHFDVVDQAIELFFKMLPIGFYVILLSMVTGFCYWILEAYTWRKDVEYPKCFIEGWMKGTWWTMMSLVSLSPVSVPKSILGRLFTFGWTLFALTAVAQITGTLTTVLVRPHPIASMEGKTIVTLDNRPLNELVILKNYGKVETGKNNDVNHAIDEVLDLGMSKKYGGALVDKFLFKTYLSGLSKRNPEKFDELLRFLYLMNVEHLDEAYYGLAIKDQKVYNYFKEVVDSYGLNFELKIFQDRKDVIDAYKKLQSQTEKLTGSVFFSFKRSLFKWLMIACALTIVMQICVGLVYECMRSLLKKTRVKDSDGNQRRSSLSESQSQEVSLKKDERSIITKIIEKLDGILKYE